MPPWLSHLILLDSETTGVVTEGDDRDYAWELAFREVRAGNLSRGFSQLFNPGKPIPGEVREVCHIDDALLAEIEAAPRFTEKAPHLLGWLSRQWEAGAVLMAYNGIDFDWHILRGDFARAGLLLPDLGAPGSGSPVMLDPCIWVRALYRGNRDRSLGGAFHGLSTAEVEGRPHRASYDCLMTFHVARGIADRHPEIFDRPPSDVWAWQEEQRQRQAEIWGRWGYYVYEDEGQLRCGFGKHCGRPLTEIPDFCSWALGKFGEEMPEAARSLFGAAAKLRGRD